MEDRGFIGREKELSILEDEYNSIRSFVLITGRRRVGKTRLITEFISKKDAMYFYCDKINSIPMLDGFSKCISEYSGRTYGQFKDWKDAFTAFSECKPGKKILAMDEFQNIVYADKNISAYLQDIWDNVLSKTDIMLIVCGSHISVMEDLIRDKSEPLYGRFTRHIRVRQLPFDVVRDDDYVTSLERYAVHGGIPKYMELLRDGPLKRSIELDVMDPTSMLYYDPVFMLNDEVRETASYASILRSIANGNHRPVDIASNLQIKETSLGKPLRTLMEMGLLRRDTPITDDPEKSKNALYMFDDNYSSFWFKFVSPFTSALEIGQTEGALAYWNAHFYEHHVAFVFEEICRRSVYKMSKEIGFVPRKVGRYWNKKYEIDIVALDTDGKKAFVAECKCRENKPVGSHELNALMSKAEDLKSLKEYDIRYGLFSITGFTDEVKKRDVLLVDKGKIM